MMKLGTLPQTLSVMGALVLIASCSSSASSPSSSATGDGDGGTSSASASGVDASGGSADATGSGGTGDGSGGTGDSTGSGGTGDISGSAGAGSTSDGSGGAGNGTSTGSGGVGSGTSDGVPTGGSTSDGSGGSGSGTSDGVGGSGGSTGDGVGGSGGTGDGVGGTGSTGDGVGGTGNTGDGSGGTGNTGDGSGGTGNTGDGSGGGTTTDPPPDCFVNEIDNVNVIVFNDASPTGADSEGIMWVGGDFSSAGGYTVASFANSPGDAITCADYGLVVGGDLSGPGAVNVPNGWAAYGGTRTATVYSACGSEKNANVVDFVTLEATFNRYSQALAALPQSPTALVGMGGGLILQGSEPGLNVFTVTAAQLSSISSLSITVPDGASVLVNVSGTDVSMTGMGFTVNGGMCRGAGADNCHNVLFNFYETQTILLDGIGFQGSILAPLASANLAGGNVDGQVIVYNLTGGAEYHPYYFTGCLELPWW